MKQKITLDKYLNIGGLIDNIDWSKAYSEYSDINQNTEIISFQDKGEMNGNYKQIHFTFKNGNTHRYIIYWIIVEVELILNPKYTKTKI